MSQPQYRWSQQSLDELVETYQREIHPEFEADSTPTDQGYPSADWLRQSGYSGLRYALREHHDRTFREFLLEDVGLEADDYEPSSRFGIRDHRTAEAVDAYFSRREDLGLLDETTLASKRSRMKRWVREYRRVHGDDALVPAAADAADEPTERQRCRRVLDKIAPTLGSDGSRLTYVSEVRSVYSWLADEGYIAFNPLSRVESEYAWERATPDNHALSTEQVRILYETAATPAENLLVIGLAGWGLRPNELAALHVRQLVLDGDDPHIAFDEERKNGPGSVAMLYGREAVEDRIDEVSTDRVWNGYLFPSPSATAGHIVSDTVANRFRRLAERANVEVAGRTPTPKMGRRYWYQTFSDALATIMEQLEAIAEEQGSASAAVVWSNYHSEEERRDRRRRAMRDQLATAFGTTAEADTTGSSIFE